LEVASKYYVKAGFQGASECAKATGLLFEAYVHMDAAKGEKDPEKKSKLYAMAERARYTAPPLAFHHKDKFMACFEQKARATTLNMRKWIKEFVTSYREETSLSDFGSNALLMIFLPCLMKIKVRVVGRDERARYFFLELRSNG
jgi:hypothetical protein